MTTQSPSLHWRLKKQRYQLDGATCTKCQQPVFPPKPICTHCSIEKVEEIKKTVPHLSNNIMVLPSSSWVSTNGQS